MATSATSSRPSVIGEDGRDAPRIDRVEAAVYVVPTDRPESDGTLAWSSTTLVLVRVHAGGARGLGYTYASAAAARVVVDLLGPAILGGRATDTSSLWTSMVSAVRNIGRPGIAATAISATDTALWDLKAKLLGVPLADLLGRARDRVPAYGSGGFTSYTDDELAAQLHGWATDGFAAVKMKIGREPAVDGHRVEVARRAIGDDVALFTDANGAYHAAAANLWARRLGDRGVSWFEEPVSSDDVAGLRDVRHHAPPGLAVAAGEYAWGPDETRLLVEGEAIDVLQLDATRCLGITGFLAGAAIAEAWHLPLSSHCAPALHVHPMLAVRPGIHMEWFHDHVRLEQLLFDGAPRAVDGTVGVDASRPGLGLELREADAAPFLEWRST
jgi:L-alanine-DL-glutamate epimerase-like enolase superfamily enzyme